MQLWLQTHCCWKEMLLHNTFFLAGLTLFLVSFGRIIQLLAQGVVDGKGKPLQMGLMGT